MGSYFGFGNAVDRLDKPLVDLLYAVQHCCRRLQTKGLRGLSPSEVAATHDGLYERSLSEVNATHAEHYERFLRLGCQAGALLHSLCLDD